MAQEIIKKICSDCNIEKLIEEFKYSHRIMVRCKVCHNRQRSIKREEAKANCHNITKICKNCKKEDRGSEFEIGTLLCKVCYSEKIKEENNRPTENDPDKTCRKSNITKSAIMFRKTELICKECNKLKLYEWRKKNKERLLHNSKNTLLLDNYTSDIISNEKLYYLNRVKKFTA